MSGPIHHSIWLSAAWAILVSVGIGAGLIVAGIVLAPVVLALVPIALVCRFLWTVAQGLFAMIETVLPKRKEPKS